MGVVGNNPPRTDGMEKVSGHVRYTDDLSRPGMIHGATVRSPYPHARIQSIRWNPPKAPTDAICLTAQDIPGINAVRVLDDTWPALAQDEVRHIGEPVALVAAPTRQAARQALAAVEVKYEQLSPVLSWEEAEAAEPLYELTLETGDVDRALAESEAVVEAEYRTGHQEHIYVECQGMIAWFEEDGFLRVQGSLQCPYYVKNALVPTLGLPEDRVGVEGVSMGGAFGGKEDYPSVLAIHAALLARASGKPVKMVYDRHEDIIATTKRHPSRIRHRTGARRDGTLQAMDIQLDLDGGAYLTLSPVVVSRAVLHATGPYRCPHVRIRGRVLRTHTVPNGAFRGFGAPQSQFAAERQIDRLGRALGFDPLEIRLRNVVGPGDCLATEQVLDGSASGRLCLEEIERRTDFRRKWRKYERARAARRRRDGKAMRGIGLSLYFHGAGFTGLGEHRMRSPASVRLTSDGKIEVLTAATEMGQGMQTSMRQIAAEAAGVALEDVVLHPPDTRVVPDSGPTVASRTTAVVGATVARAASQLRDRVLLWVAGEANGDVANPSGSAYSNGSVDASGPADSNGSAAPEDATPSDAGSLEVREGEVYREGQSLGAFRSHAQRFREFNGPTEITVRHEPPDWQVFDEQIYHGAAYAAYAWGADVVEVAVDPDTFETEATQATAVCEVGKVIHPTLCEGQIAGGTLQAIGFGLLEEIKVEEGRFLNDRLATYIVPTIKDTPKMDVHLLERPWEGGPFGAKGVGELPMDGGAPAVVQAVENATGVVPDRIPATPERIYEWIGRGQDVESLTRGKGRSMKGRGENSGESQSEDRAENSEDDRVDNPEDNPENDSKTGRGEPDR